MNILGISAFYHESSCCLLQDGELVAAASEERFSRRKHDPRPPVESFRFCLEAGGLSLAELDAVAYYEEPVDKLARQLWAGAPSATEAGQGGSWLDPRRPEDLLRRRLGFDGPFLTFPHHLGHAASAFCFSGFDEAALLAVDGVGEWTTTSYGQGGDHHLELFEEVRFPHSLGLLYATLTSYLGFAVNDGEYKVMGLAPYGEPRFVDAICQLVGMGPDGQFALNLRHFDFIRGRRMYSESLPRLFGRPPRRPGEPLEEFHHHVARSLQLVLEEILLEKAAYLHRRTGSENLCLAGGVALNCVANGRLRREGPFRRVFVQPAAGDAGGCLGAAALAHHQLTGEGLRRGRMEHAYLGPCFESDTIADLLTETPLEVEDHRGVFATLLDGVVDRLIAGRVVAWFQGAMEFGPRALGARSILADPRIPEMRQRLNAKVKLREGFRPFAPSVLAERAAEHFDLGEPAPEVGDPSSFMLETYAVRSPLGLPAITHVDGSARPQLVFPDQPKTAATSGRGGGGAGARYGALLRAFEARTGCPILVNTSFNVRGEPIVCSPIDALFCLGHSGIDSLVLGDCLIDRESLPEAWPELLAVWERRDLVPTLDRHLYTFV